jgi:anti-anti-sigma regulatory factor
MLELSERTRAQGIEFKLMNVSKFVGRVLEVTRLNSVFEIMSCAELDLPSQSQVASAKLAACAQCDT